jgi:hypothetical protein
MEEEKNPSERWVDGAENFVQTYRDLITIRIIDQTSRGVSLSILGMITLMFTLCILMFVGLGTAWWLGKELGDTAAGFFIVGGAFLLIISLLLLTARKFLLPILRNIVIKEIYEEDK